MGKSEMKTSIPMINGEFDYEFLYNHSSKLIFYVIRRLINDEDVVKDLVQDTYISVFKNIDDLDEYTLEDFTRWSARIASNNAKQYLRKKRPMAFTDLTGDEFDLNQELEDEGTFESPDVTAHKEEISQIVAEIMDSLPEDQRLCVFMFYFEDKTTKEISEELDLSENTIKSRLRYGRDKIKDMLSTKEAQGFKFFSVAPIPIFVYGLKNGAEFVKPIPFKGFALAMTPFGKIKQLIKNGLDKVFSNPVILASAVATGTLAVIGINNSLKKEDPINPLEYVEVIFEGYDKNGVAKYEWHDDSYEVDLNFDKSENLSNGDVIKLSTKDGAFDREFEVNGLKDITKVDLYQYLKVSFSGLEGQGIAHVSLMKSDDPDIDIYLEKIELEYNQDSTLRNNDLFEIKVFVPQVEGYQLISDNLEYKVSGLKQDIRPIIMKRIYQIHDKENISEILYQQDTDLNGEWISDSLEIISIELTEVKIGKQGAQYVTYSESKLTTNDGTYQVGVVSQFDPSLKVSSDIFGAIKSSRVSLESFKSYYLKDVVWE